MKDHVTRRTAACLIVAVIMLSSIPAVIAAKTPRATGTLGKGDYGVVDDTPYYGGFGAGFLHINADGTYGGGEIRSGDLGLKFYGPTFGGPYRFQLHVKDAKGEWNGDLVAGGSNGLYGEHSDDLLGLPSQLSRERVKQHLKHLFDHHYNGKTFLLAPGLGGGSCMANAEGLRDFTALALWRGITEEAMTVAQCFYEVIFTHFQREWNQPMLINSDCNPTFGNHYQSVPGAWHVLLGLEGIRWDVPGKKLSLRPNLPASFQGKLRTFLPGAVTWGGLDYSCVESDCDQKFVLTFERPFELEFLGVRNSGKPIVRATQGGNTVPCSIKVVNADEYEVRFTKPLKLDGKPLEIRIGSK